MYIYIFIFIFIYVSIFIPPHTPITPDTGPPYSYLPLYIPHRFRFYTERYLPTVASLLSWLTIQPEPPQ